MKNSVIVLNWNGWRDTVECLETLFHLDCPDSRVVVCDNASTDESLTNIRKWAEGYLSVEPANPALSHLTSPPFRKPIWYRELTRHEAETERAAAHEERLILIRNEANLGFAAGNNVGLRYALGDTDCQYFWILNNDTVVEPDALSAIVRFFESRPGLGLCGSVNRSYHAPYKIQVRGGRLLNRWTGRTHKSKSVSAGTAFAPARIDYVEGSSMVANRCFLEQVGLMDESYFLYCEELDWAMRARGKLTLGYAPESVVYHKEGASIGSNSDRSKRSLLSERYLSRSRVLFMRRYFPWALLTTIGSMYLAAAYQFWRGDLDRAKTTLVWAVKGLFARSVIRHDPHMVARH
jgi:GT2 family glycosyltransferase